MIDEFDKYLTPEQRSRLKRTIEHFLKDPDYATGDEKGLSFKKISFGDPLPLEIVIRDWNTEMDEGEGGRIPNGGDCYDIYQLLYERGLLKETAQKRDNRKANAGEMRKQKRKR